MGRRFDRRMPLASGGGPELVAIGGPDSGIIERFPARRRSDWVTSMNWKTPLALWSVALLACPGSAVAAGADKADSAADLSRWVKQLSSDDYGAREEATEKLIRAGRPAIPAVAVAAQEDDLEVTSRSMDVLRELLNSDDSATEEAAAGALTKLSEAQGTASAEMAAEVLGEVQDIRRQKAIKEVQQLGAILSFGDPETRDTNSLQVIINSDWRGKGADLALLKRIVDVERLTFRGVPLADEDLQHLEGLPRLRKLDLLGSKITSKGMSQLARAYPNVRIDHGSNAMLGVAGDPEPTLNGFMVTMVQTGTAAERGGIMPGDIVLKIQNRQVVDFDSLTAEIHNHLPGEKVTIELRRGGDSLKKEVTLGQWK